MKYTAIIDGKPVDIELSRGNGRTIEARIGGESYVVDVEAVEPGVYWFHWNNRSIEVSVVPNGDGYAVQVGSQRTNVEIVDARAALRRAALQVHAGTVELRAPMPGKIVRVLVREGAAVELNQGVLVMEAMKMQNEIKSPKKGVVKKLGVQEGAAVNAGDLLAAVE
jgi:biotin carboxyl carrier protein